MPVKKQQPLMSLDEIAAALEQAKRTRKGRVSFDSVLFEDLLPALSLHIDVSGDMPERDQAGIASRAIRSTGRRRRRITAASLKAALKVEVASYKNQPLRTYVLATALSFRRFRELKPRRVGRWTVRFASTLPTHFDRSHVPEHDMRRFGHHHRTWVHALVRGRARAQQEAVERGLDALDVIRGIWNLALNRGILSSRGSDETRPFNEVRAGPLHTLHNPNGSRASDNWWYEYFPSDEEMPAFHSHQWDVVEEQEQDILYVLARTRLGRELQPVLVQYCRALDGRDPEVSLLRLWGVLETLTDTSSVSQAETARRGLFVFGDEPLVRQTLALLRARRNRMAHAGTAGLDARHALSQLQRYAANLLTVALQVSGQIRSLAEFGQWLRHPNSPAGAKRAAELALMARQFHSATGLRNTLKAVRARRKK